MALTIITNIASLRAQHNLDKTNTAINANINRLSAGSRIVSASDDPAGLAISEKLKSQIRGTLQSKRNAEDGISLLQVAEGGMEEVGHILIRMKELALQASNETLSGADRLFLDTEFQELDSEIQRISISSKFNGRALLSGAFSMNGLILQVGLTASSADMMTVNIVNVGSDALGSGTFIQDITIAASAGVARNSLKFIERAIEQISNARSQVGSQLSRLNSTVNNLGTAAQNLQAANSRIRDVDVANETADLTKNQILMQAGISVLSTANASPQIALSLL